jgi:membrane associated rhomboid family serine protease
MPSLRSAWNPVTPLAAVLVLSLAALLAPADQRPGWLGLIVLLLSPVAAIASVRAVRSAMARVPAAPPGGAPPRAERWLSAGLQTLVAVLAWLGPLTVLLAELARQRGELRTGEMAILVALPPTLGILGARLWRDLRAVRGDRATTVEPWRLARASVTGLPELDARIGRPPRAAPRIAWVLGFTSAAAWVAAQVVRGQPILSLLMKVNERIRDGEVWRIFTAPLVHGSLAALVVNAWAFLAVGPLLELLLGTPRLVFVFAVGGVAGTFASFALAPGPFLGAAGAVAAVAAAVLALAARLGRRLPAATRRRAFIHGCLALGLVAVGAVLLPEVDLPAVGGGAVFGALAGLAFDPPEDARVALQWTARPGRGA